jgi:HSF-type DNA-binding
MIMMNQNSFPQSGGMGQGNDPLGGGGVSGNVNQGGNNLMGVNSNNAVSSFLRGGNPNGGQGMMGMGNPDMGGISGGPVPGMMNNPNAQAQMNVAMNMNNFNLHDLKRLQQLQQFQQATANQSNAFLGIPGQGHPQQDPSAAFLQSFIDQKIHSSRFGELGMGGLQAAGFQGTGFQGQNSVLGSANLLMMGGALGGNAVLNNGGGASNEVPLPSPHSLFHRDGSRRMRGGVIEPFPEKLHRLLSEVETAGRGDVISFVANGRAFAIHKPDKFFKEIVPLYFRQSRLSSFKRQLNLYGFELINTGPARGGYYHELFVRDSPELCRRMRRVAVKVSPNTKGDPCDVSKAKDGSENAAEKTGNILEIVGDGGDGEEQATTETDFGGAQGKQTEGIAE